MSGPTWSGETPPPLPPISVLGWLRVILRGGGMVLVILTGLALLLTLRLIERPIHGAARPWTPWITQSVCRLALGILRLEISAEGPCMEGPGAIVANHSSWLDILVLNARRNVYFVSKAEVAGWPFIGWLARATGTVFIRRNPREAAVQKRVFEERLLQGHRLLFFPEGTSTDGIRVLPFKPTLFAAFFTPDLRHVIQVQAVAVIYRAPPGADRRFYGWWGDMALGPHLAQVLAAPKQGRVSLVYHTPLRVDDVPNRKTLARRLEEELRTTHEAARRN